MKVWSRLTDAGNTTYCYFCPDCGSRLIHAGVLKNGKDKETVTIKAGAIKGLEWVGGKHIWCKSAVVPIPEEAEERWDEEPGVVSK
jgi:hypothetical protein